MKRSFCALIVVSIFAVGCGSSKPGGGTTGNVQKEQPNQKPKPKPTAKDREAFLGKWKGKYGLEGAKVDDTLTIKKGEGDLDVLIHLHEANVNPDKVKGELEDAKTIKVPSQTMGGAPGTAKLMVKDGSLTLEQSGLGLTVKGTYTKEK